jgi:hypothetical protein
MIEDTFLYVFAPAETIDLVDRNALPELYQCSNPEPEGVFDV